MSANDLTQALALTGLVFLIFGLVSAGTSDILKRGTFFHREAFITALVSLCISPMLFVASIWVYAAS